MNDRTFIDSDAAFPRRWLVVDDEPQLSDLIADVLAQMNQARVESFTSSPDALAAFLANSEGFDLVITDRDMPGLDGMELARRLRARAPGVKIILVTANMDDVSIEDMKRAGVHDIVQKPFTLARLEATIRKITCSPLCNDACPGAPVFARAA